MSAFLVEPQHITELVKWARKNRMNFVYNMHKREQIDCEPKNLIKILAQANIDSMLAKYQDAPEADGFLEECYKNLKYSTDGVSVSLLDGVGESQLGADDIYNMVNCLDYQSCEVDDWQTTDAYWVLTAIQGMAGRRMAESAKVKWEYRPSNVEEVA
jgi:hypothetical protein